MEYIEERKEDKKPVQDTNVVYKYEEMKFVDDINHNRFGLLQKVPLMAFCGLSFLMVRHLRFTHDNLITRLCFVRISGSRGKMVHNSLQFCKLLFILINLCSCVSGVCLSSYSYSVAFHRRYFIPIEREEELLRSNLEHIKTYRSLNI